MVSFEMFTPIKTVISPELFEQRAVHIVDLAPTKNVVGALWGELNEGICRRLEAILKKRLMPTAYYEKATETRYVIVTPDMQDGNAALFAFRVASEFETALNGHTDLGQIRISRAVPAGAGRIKGVPIRADALASMAEKTLPVEDEKVLRRSPNMLANSPSRHVQESQDHKELKVIHRFEPVWDARHQIVSTYLCVPATISFGEPQREAKLEDLTARERTAAELSCLRAGVGYLSRFIETGDRFLLASPISFETLCQPNGRMEFAGMCRGLPALYRQYITFLLTDVPLGVTQSRLSDLAMVLRPFRHVIATVASGCRNFPAYDGNGFTALALDLAKEPDDAERVRADILHVGLAGRTTRHGAMILNVAERNILNMASAADYQFLHGAIVGQPLKVPRRMSHLASAMVMPQSAEGGSEEWF